MPDLDVLVVGSGPVGLTLAKALDARGMRVLVLEVGPRESALPRTDQYDVLQEGDTLDSIAEARTRRVGGGLNLWGGQIGLLEPIDVEDANRWPLRHSQVYAQLEETLAIAGVDGRNVAERLIRSFISPPATTRSNSNIRVVETAWLPAPKFNRGFWRWLETSATCHLWHGALCIGLEGGGASTPRALVKLGADQSRVTAIAAKIVVLAAGTLENARLLMLPTKTTEAQGWKQNRWLGRGFNDHLDVSVGCLLVNDRQRLADTFDLYVRDGIKYLPKIVWNDRSATSTGLGACGLPVYSMTTTQTLHELRLLFKNLAHQPSARGIAQLPKAVLNSAYTVAPLVTRYMAARRIGRPGKSEVHFRISVEQPTRPQSSVRLSDTDNDGNGLPRCVVSWRRGDAELQAMLEFAESANQWFVQSGLGRIEIEPSLTAQSPEFWNLVNSGLHHAGTTRMGATARDGVVDSQLRVFGARGLYVCGASTFPSSGYVNPTLTAMALAARLANHLASDLNAA